MELWESPTPNARSLIFELLLNLLANHSTGMLSACKSAQITRPDARSDTIELISHPSVGIVNEILWGTIGQQAVQSFYLAAYEAIRKSTYVFFLFVTIL